jgi:hypothetical protein
MPIQDQIQNRAMSGFPVSIGTGLALQTVFTPTQDLYDETREAPEMIDVTKYETVVFNVETLFRNLLSSIKGDISNLKVKDLYSTLVEEIEFLKLFTTQAKVKCKFYNNSYSYAKRTYASKNKIRIPTTAKQSYVANLKDLVFTFLRFNKDVVHHDKFVTPATKETALIFTHMPWDLLSFRSYHSLDLLESHTGVIKPRSVWNTKYLPIPNKDMSFIPFDEYLLVTFGDHVLFHPDDLKKRQDVYSQLVRLKVNPLTTTIGLN